MEITVGTPLYLSQRTGDYWVDMVKKPYTVIDIKPNEIIIQEALCVFNGPRYYDTLADDIVANPYGKVVTLKKSRAKKYKDQWVYHSYPGSTYPYVATFGAYDYQPYLN
jgi:hypothetical protein